MKLPKTVHLKHAKFRVYTEITNCIVYFVLLHQCLHQCFMKLI